MGVFEILKIEADNKNKIILFREGLFWRAYEKSAFLFVKQIKAYSINKKYFKNVDSVIVYCGFPDTALDGLLEKHNNMEITRQDKIIKISNFQPIDNEVFSKWKNGFMAIAEESKPQDAVFKNNQNLEKEIVVRIRNFNVATSTPLQCQELLINLQHQLDGAL